MSDTEQNINPDDDYHSEEDVFNIFSAVPIGLNQDGTLTAVAGMSSFLLTEMLGIEPFFGLSGFKDAKHYKSWVEGIAGYKLADWEPCDLTLYQNWLNSPDYEDWFEHPGHVRDPVLICYMSWDAQPRQDAVHIVPKRVFALRHVKHELARTRSVVAFHCARQRSYAETAWGRLHPGEEITPRIMTDYGFCDGVYLKGRLNGREKDEVLCWPTDDLREVIAVAKELKSTKFDSLYICNDSLCIDASDLESETIKRVVESFDYNGPGVSLFDVVISA
ncbi:hypothetical protein [Aeromonas caviae]|uniref:hypothetical protein n=1 Tax=Aeromonas caviae TaxID=648 RepID=UPI0029D6756C|nr:hypothetical protein [Aeromonas caviae]MDX7853078.1 hypothetical protein [Aeromonas caviae]